MNETVNELQDLGNTVSTKAKLMSWAVVGGMLTGVYMLGKRSGKNHQQ